MKYKCECQYVKVEPMLRAKILARLTPQELDPDSYDGMESWDWTEVDGIQYDLNFWFDDDKFNITAYFLTEEDGVVVTDNCRFFRILSKTVKDINEENE
jgi:hypothetical protein